MVFTKIEPVAPARDPLSLLVHEKYMAQRTEKNWWILTPSLHHKAWRTEPPHVLLYHSDTGTRYRLSLP